MIIGRDPQVAITLPGNDVSRRHAQLRLLGPASVEVVDLESRNGTLINGLQVQRGMLTAGDKLRVGNTVFVLTFRDDLDEQLAQAGRLQAIGEIAGRVVHDLNNVFTALSNNLFFLDALPGTTNLTNVDVRDVFQEMQEAVKRASNLGSQLLGFARSAPGEHSAVLLGQVIDEVVRLVRRTVPRSVRIDARIDDRLAALGERGHLFQVFLNLCVNAGDAMPKGGTLTVRGRERLVDPEEAARLGCASGAYAEVVVQDEGVGMDAETMQRVFEPFFTTRMEGTGLGLATVSEFVRQHGGTVQVESTPGEGTSFSVLLRLAETDRDISTRTTTQKMFRIDHTATLLVVDADHSVRSAVNRALERLSVTVYEAAQVSAALVQVQSHPQIDLVLLDLDLADVAADEAIVRLRAACNARIVVTCSPGDELRAASVGADGVLPKPFDPDAVWPFLTEPPKHRR